MSVQRSNLVARRLFLTAALLSFGFSVALFFSDEENAGIFVAALGLIAWGIVNERRDRTRFEQGRQVFGEPTAAMQTSSEPGAATP